MSPSVPLFVSTVTLGQALCPSADVHIPLFSFSLSLILPPEPVLMSALPGACHIRRGNNPWNDCSLFLTLLLSVPVSPSFFPPSPSFSCSHFPRTMPLHAPLSCWATSVTKMAFAQHVHATHSKTRTCWCGDIHVCFSTTGKHMHGGGQKCT